GKCDIHRSFRTNAKKDIKATIVMTNKAWRVFCSFASMVVFVMIDPSVYDCRLVSKPCWQLRYSFMIGWIIFSNNTEFRLDW
ncbi:hypothetical protein AAULR_15749, partial [Lacticaseibacillus rhamnosus MTCC 5462]